MRITLISAMLLSLLAAAAASAAPGWIGDTLYVPLRAGAGGEFRIVHRGLKTGTEVEVLQLEEGAEWAQVRYGDTEGYVNAQYLVTRPPAMIRLQQLEAQYSKQGEQLTAARQQISTLTAERDQLQASNQRLGGSLQTRTAELEHLQEVAAEPVRLDQANRELNETLSQLRTELSTVKAEAELLRNDRTTSMWMVGAGILIGGWLVGWLMRASASRRQSSWT